MHTTGPGYRVEAGLLGGGTEHLVHPLEHLHDPPRARIRHGRVPDLVLVDVGRPARLGIEVARRLCRLLGVAERARERLGVRRGRREGEDEGREGVDERAGGGTRARVLVERVERELRSRECTDGSACGTVKSERKPVQGHTSSPRAQTSRVASLAPWSLAASSSPLLSPLSKMAYKPPLVPPISFSTTAEMATMAATTSSSGTRFCAMASRMPSAPALSVRPASPSPAIVS